LPCSDRRRWGGGLLACLLLVGGEALAQGPATPDLGQHIAPGLWQFSYQRYGEFKPLRLKREESGNKPICLTTDPRQQIHDWLTSKGCSVKREDLTASVYRIEGQCRLKWWKQRPIAAEVRLTFVDRQHFEMRIESRNDSVFDYRELTRARYLGACPTEAGRQAALSSPLSPAGCAGPGPCPGWR